jgi:hypothetical protein
MRLYGGGDWSSNPLSILDCLTKYTGHYFVQVSAETSVVQRSIGGTRLTVSKGAVPLYSWSTFPEGQFLIAGSILYHTEFDLASTGMAVVAFDLEAQDTVWATSLTGIGVDAHSVYRNWGASLHLITTELVVCGTEAIGPYIVILDLATGRQLAHRQDSWAEK